MDKKVLSFLVEQEDHRRIVEARRKFGYAVVHRDEDGFYHLKETPPEPPYSREEFVDLDDGPQYFTAYGEVAIRYNTDDGYCYMDGCSFHQHGVGVMERVWRQDMAYPDWAKRNFLVTIVGARVVLGGLSKNKE